jgi:hypothetical protein
MSAATLITDAERCWRVAQMVAAIQASNGVIPAIYAADLDELEERLMATGRIHAIEEIAVDLAFWMAFGEEWRP